MNILKLHHESSWSIHGEAITIPQYAAFKKNAAQCDSITAEPQWSAASLNHRIRAEVAWSPRYMNEKMAELPSSLRFDCDSGDPALPR
jgi:hypothetical protein